MFLAVSKKKISYHEHGNKKLIANAPVFIMNIQELSMYHHRSIYKIQRACFSITLDPDNNNETKACKGFSNNRSRILHLTTLTRNVKRSAWPNMDLTGAKIRSLLLLTA